MQVTITPTQGMQRTAPIHGVRPIGNAFVISREDDFTEERRSVDYTRRDFKMNALPHSLNCAKSASRVLRQPR